MNSTDFKTTINNAIEYARKKGASAAEANIGSGTGFAVTARMGEAETVEHQNDKGLSITLYIGNKKGSASTSDFSQKALEETIDAAYAIAKNSGEDEYAGLIDAKYLAGEIPDLELANEWDLTPEAAIEMAIECETLAREYDKRITNSEGATIQTYFGRHYYGNSHGFVGGWDWTTHSIDCSVIAETNGQMQRDGWYTRSRHQAGLEDSKEVARKAAGRALARLGSRKISTQSVPVIFEAQIAPGLLGSLVNGISGSAQYRKSTFLLDKMGERLFPDHINISEKPHIKKAIGSTPFDNDGMATTDRVIIQDGVLQGYILSAYSARKLDMEPTGNAGGVHNLIIEPGPDNLDTMIKNMGKGLLVTELIGFGVNQVTGDYSRGAAGFWIENGEISHPVEEITIAGNLADMFMQIVTTGSDIDTRGNIQSGSIWIENMTVAGD